MSKRGLAAVVCGLVVVSAFAQAQFPDIPVNHWVYNSLFQLNQEGLLPGNFFHNRLSSGPSASRRDISVLLRGAWLRVRARQTLLRSQVDDLSWSLDGTNANLDRDALSFLLNDYSRELARLESDDVPRLSRLIDTFQSELTKLGADVRDMKLKIATQFPDVPTSHWAAKDLFELKANGIVVGYSEGRYRGG